MSTLAAVVEGLLAQTKASRVTLRQDLPGDYAFPVTHEALASEAVSLMEERTVDLRTQPVVAELAQGRQVVQDDCRAAFDDPAFQQMLETYGGLASQIVTPILRHGRLIAILSLHQLGSRRRWTAEEIETTTRAAQQIGDVLVDPPGGHRDRVGRGEGHVRISAGRAHNRWHPDLEVVAAVAPGEEITLETRDGLDGQLTRDSAHEDAGRLDLGLGHPLTGPVWVTGAEPGDLLEVELVSYETTDFGVTALIPGFGFLADLFPEPYVVHWELQDGWARSPELPGVAVPEATFAGVIGVTPSHGLMEEIRRREQAIADAGGPVADSMPERALPPDAASGLRTIPPREIGGNIDIRQLVAGSRLFLPVHVSGALFSIGDLHFAQGDGEVCGTGIEVAGAATVRFRLRKEHELAWRQRFPRYEAPPEAPRGPTLATTGIALDVPMDVDAAAREALLEMIGYLTATYRFERAAAYALCSVAVDLRISEVVDVPYPLVSALLPLDIFE